MKVFNVILGVFALFGASYCILFPGKTFLTSGWVVTMLLAVWGICAVFSFFTEKKEGKSSKSEMILGILGIVMGIAAATITLLGIFMAPIFTTLLVDMTMLLMFCLWLFISGIDSIVAAIRIKKTTGSKWWIFTLVMGILVLLGAVYGLFHGIFLAQMIGLGIGYLLICYGVRLIASAFENND